MSENVATAPVDCMLRLILCFCIGLSLVHILALTKCFRLFLLLRGISDNHRLPFVLNWLERNERLSLSPTPCRRCCWKHFWNDLSVVAKSYKLIVELIPQLRTWNHLRIMETNVMISQCSEYSGLLWIRVKQTTVPFYIFLELFPIDPLSFIEQIACGMVLYFTVGIIKHFVFVPNIKTTSGRNNVMLVWYARCICHSLRSLSAQCPLNGPSMWMSATITAFTWSVCTVLGQLHWERW